MDASQSTTANGALPDDIPTLKRLLAARDEMIARLMAEIARLKRWQYGRKSERRSELMAQLQLALGDLPIPGTPAAAESAAVPPQDSTEAATGDPRVVPLRRKARAFPAHLPREIVVHAPPGCDCPECGKQMRALGEDVSEVLDFIPGYFKVIRHVRPKLACGHCARVVQEPAPSRPIARGMAAPGLLAQVVVAKYADHSPLYRQEGIYRRSGVELDRATLAAWVGEAAHLLTPLAEAIGRYVRQAGKIHTDDTPVPVLDPGRGSTRTARLWTYVRDDRPAGNRGPPAVWYRYSPDRKGERARAHLHGYAGILQADGYSGYGALYADGQILEAACWAHVRRKFYDLLPLELSPIAAEAIRRIGQRYALERAIRGQLPTERRAVRQERSAPLLADLRSWLEDVLVRLSAKSGLAKAIHYALVRWMALTRFCDDGAIEIDNNTAERAIRPLVLGRKNYLFQGSDRGGESAAAIYTLIGTARLNDVEPFAYLRAVFERIADHPINRIDELLPWRLEPVPSESLRRAA
jgi:transposase